MSKYTIHSTKQDWENLYKQVAKFPELDVKTFKKSQNFDSAAYAFISYVGHHEGISYIEVSQKYPLYVNNGVIKAVAN